MKVGKILQKKIGFETIHAVFDSRVYVKIGENLWKWNDQNDASYEYLTKKNGFQIRFRGC